MMRVMSLLSSWSFHGVIIGLAFFVSACALPSEHTSSSAHDNDPRSSKIAKLVQARHDAGQFDGVILVAEGDKILFHRAFGLANREWRIPHTTESRLFIGSVGKQMTGAIVLQLIEEGKLDLDQSIKDIFPQYPETHGHKVKIRHLVNHTSGIPNYTQMDAFQRQSGRPVSRGDVISLFHDLPLEFEPGKSFSYTNSGFFLLSVIIEHIEGKAYGEVLQERLLTPLGLANTGYVDGLSIIDNYASAYRVAESNYRPELHTDESWIVGNGMTYTTAHDLFIWTQMLFEGRPFSDSNSHDLMLKLPEGQDRNYNFGIGNVPLTLDGQTYRGLGHSGALGGFRATQSHVLEPEWTVVVLANNGIDQNELADKILDLLASETDALPEPDVVTFKR